MFRFYNFDFTKKMYLVILFVKSNQNHKIQTSEAASKIGGWRDVKKATATLGKSSQSFLWHEKHDKTLWLLTKLMVSSWLRKKWGCSFCRVKAARGWNGGYCMLHAHHCLLLLPSDRYLRWMASKAVNAVSSVQPSVRLGWLAALCLLLLIVSSLLFILEASQEKRESFVF